MSQSTLKTSLVAVLVALCGAAQANPVVFSSVGGAPSGANRWNLDATVEPSGTILTTITPNAGFVTGSATGQYAAPFLSGSNGAGFGAGGSNQAGGQDQTQYLTTGSTGATPAARIQFAFNAPQLYFGLLWGSVDLYNSIAFFNGDDSVGTLTGADASPAATGNQGVEGTRYVNINFDKSYNRVVFTSSQFAFEFDNVAWASTRQGVPEPATLALVGAALLGFGAVRARRSTR
ncbi:MAG: PEP-CTERM sorting domain-containing protein [Chitinophagaceae bacterium]|nr:PEP-CTERM sorting domain-containing protein [Rubrivivax sp.]